MPRKLYPEHEILPVPEMIELCLRCKVALIFRPYKSGPKCDKCGDTGRDGELYLRAESAVEALMTLKGRTLEQAALSIGKLLPAELLQKIHDKVKADKANGRKGNGPGISPPAG